MQTKENHKFLVRNKGKDQLEFAYMLAEQITIQNVPLLDLHLTSKQRLGRITP